MDFKVNEPNLLEEALAKVDRSAELETPRMISKTWKKLPSAAANDEDALCRVRPLQWQQVEKKSVDGNEAIWICIASHANQSWSVRIWIGTSSVRAVGKITQKPARSAWRPVANQLHGLLP